MCRQRLVDGILIDMYARMRLFIPWGVGADFDDGGIFGSIRPYVKKEWCSFPLPLL
jgi:hypothetical protein